MPTRSESARPEHRAPVLAGQSGLADLLAQKILLSKAARMLDISVCQLHRLRLAGKFECFKIAGRWFTTEAALSALIQFSNTPTSPSTGHRTPATLRRADEAAAAECIALGC